MGTFVAGRRMWAVCVGLLSGWFASGRRDRLWLWLWLWLALALTLGGVRTSVYAGQYYYWQNAETGQWEDVENWGIGEGGTNPTTTLPTFTDDVYITEGTAELANGAKGDALDLYIANSDGSTGTLTVSGAGSELTTNAFTIGRSGNGTLFITDGGSVTAQATVLGSQNLSSDIATVSGSSTLDVAGMLTIADGCKVNVPDLVSIGTTFTGTDIVTVSDSGSELSGDGNMRVGSDGVGTLIITDYGKVTAEGTIDSGPGQVRREYGWLGRRHGTELHP